MGHSRTLGFNSANERSTNSASCGLPARSGEVMTSITERLMRGSRNTKARPLICPDCSTTRQFSVGSRPGCPKTP
ncbi:MAG: hypothetical protein BZY87_09410 [SAR202 cluster bacterium Io17-Chloro-G6]|nr:MAG: hypothetical protein BZY87_09410 [SAR202 cluster bacterium Io17-Chloro-G6]